MIHLRSPFPFQNRSVMFVQMKLPTPGRLRRADTAQLRTECQLHVTLHIYFTSFDL